MASSDEVGVVCGHQLMAFYPGSGFAERRRLPGKALIWRLLVGLDTQPFVIRIKSVCHGGNGTIRGKAASLD